LGVRRRLHLRRGICTFFAKVRSLKKIKKRPLQSKVVQGTNRNNLGEKRSLRRFESHRFLSGGSIHRTTGGGDIRGGVSQEARIKGSGPKKKEITVNKLRLIDRRETRSGPEEV